MPRVLVRPRMPWRTLPRSTFGLPRPFGTPGSGSGGCSSIAVYVVFATDTFFAFGLLNGFFLPFFTNFLAFPLPVFVENPSLADSDSSTDSREVAGSVVPTGFTGDTGNGFIDPSLSLSTPVRAAALGICAVPGGPGANEAFSSAAFAIPAVEFPASPVAESNGTGAV